MPEENMHRQYLTALIGSPVSHSLSPYIHNNAYRLLGMEGSKYIALECTESDIANMVTVLKEKHFTGFNVTMPLKNEVIKYCDELNTEAELIRGVNTVKITGGRLKGYNTDGKGFFDALEKEGFAAEKKTMTLLGSGGAARAILAGAAFNEMKRVNVFARQGKRYDETVRLIESLKGFDARLNIFDIADEALLYESARMSDVLVNATSAGMKTSEEGSADDTVLVKDTSCFRPHLFVADIIYRPKKTRLLEIAEGKKLKTMNGIPMLFYQAAHSFEIWYGKKMPEAILGNLKGR